MKGLIKEFSKKFDIIKQEKFANRVEESQEEKALFHKNAGNDCLKHGLVDEAIMHYTKSLNLNPENHVVYVNRSTAFKKHKEFQLQYEDSQIAISLDTKYFKAYLRNGEACVEMGKHPKVSDSGMIEKGIKQLQKALYLCWKLEEFDTNYDKKETYQKEIGRQILKAKKIKWYKEKELVREEQEHIMDQLESLLEIYQISHNSQTSKSSSADDSHSHNVPEDIPDERSFSQCLYLNQIQASASIISQSSRKRLMSDNMEIQQTLTSLTDQIQIRKGSFDRVQEILHEDSEPTPLPPDNTKIIQQLYDKVRNHFQKKNKANKQLDVPDYMLCRISDEMMEEPVILSSGFTYEKEQILLHFKYNGHFDPMTREEINPNILIENKNIKQATQDYLIENPWAFEHLLGEKLEQIMM